MDYLGIWERVNNPDFNITEFSNIRNQAGTNGYVLTCKQWIDRTNARGIISTAGRYGGTEADVLNVALFGQTAKMWREANPEAHSSPRKNNTPNFISLTASSKTEGQ